MSGRAFFGVMVHYRSKNTRKQFVVGPFRSFPFTLVQRCYGRTSKHPLVVRPDPLTPYVHRPFERTTKEAYVVRPVFSCISRHIRPPILNFVTIGSYFCNVEFNSL